MAHYQAQTNTPMVDRAWLLPRNPVTACRLALPMLQPDQIKDTLHAYQVSKRGNSLVMAETVRWGRIAQLKDVREKVLTDLACSSATRRRSVRYPPRRWPMPAVA